MSDGTMFLMRPVVRGLCKYESLLDGTIDLVDVARMNEAINVDENNRMALESWFRAHPNG